MNFAAGSFRVSLLPRSVVDEEDWVRVHLAASANGFIADYEAWLQLEDLRRFERELEAMYSALSGSATLASAESDIRISLSMASLGQILGTYRFESEYREGGATALTGAFELDQSYLPSLAAGVGALVSELSQKNVA